LDTPGADPDVIICGDFNTPSTASGQTGSHGITLDAVIDDDGRFTHNRALHVLVDEKTSRTSPKKGSVPANNYDHFVISDDCLEEFLLARRMDPRMVTDNDGEPDPRTSDHYPIFALFRTQGDGVVRDGLGP
jgi:hypothetical protein